MSFYIDWYVQPTEGKEAKRNQETKKYKAEMEEGENKTFFCEKKEEGKKEKDKWIEESTVKRTQTLPLMNSFPLFT